MFSLPWEFLIEKIIEVEKPDCIIHDHFCLWAKRAAAIEEQKRSLLICLCISPPDASVVYRANLYNHANL